MVLEGKQTERYVTVTTVHCICVFEYCACVSARVRMYAPVNVCLCVYCLCVLSVRACGYSVCVYVYVGIVYLF